MLLAVAVFITSTGAKHGIYHRDRIIPSSRTWMRQLYNIYVILEDTFELRHSFRHCKRQEAYNTTHTYFICPNEEPIYLLTRKCTSEYYQSGSACCKVDEAINFITHSQYKVYSRLQYFVHADDDTYFRVGK
jgi:transcription initiation factor IIE alpha subunit